jgi:hypothetical protein
LTEVDNCHFYHSFLPSREPDYDFQPFSQPNNNTLYNLFKTIMPSTTRTILSALSGAALVSAHGFVQRVVINGVEFAGFDVTSAPYQANPPTVIGWGTSATDTGFVAPDAFADPDIICHRDGANAGGYAQVAAGDSIFLQWNTWPESHKGPVIDYLARCSNDDCTSVDKTSLEFFKISEAGLVDGSTGTPGTFADDLILGNNLGWMVQIPSGIAPGQYVLRHEIIALHSAGEENGAQAYPQCFNLEITGSGSETPAGVLGTELYTPTDEGILFNIYTSLNDYPIPGPTLIAGASAVEQGSSAVQETGTATVGDGNSGNPAPTASATPTETAEPEPTDAVTSAPAPTTVVTPTSADEQVPTATATATEPEEPAPTPCGGSRKSKRSKKSKKVRRHARDVQSRNVAPIRA